MSPDYAQGNLCGKQRLAQKGRDWRILAERGLTASRLKTTKPGVQLSNDSATPDFLPQIRYTTQNPTIKFSYRLWGMSNRNAGLPPPESGACKVHSLNRQAEEQIFTGGGLRIASKFNSGTRNCKIIEPRRRLR